jgi:hypothetical protein
MKRFILVQREIYGRDQKGILTPSPKAAAI